MRRAALFIAALAVSGRAYAVERVWIGPGVAVQTVPHAMLGDGRTIVDGLGLSRTDGDLRAVVPRATVGFDFDDEAKIGLDLSAAWFHDSFTATSSTPIAYRVRRDVFPVTGLVRWAPNGRSTGVVLGAGAVVATTRFSESGWLGDGSAFNAAAGAMARVGGKLDFTDLRVSYGLYLQWLYLPRENPLLGDGGGATMVGLDLSIDIGL